MKSEQEEQQSPKPINWKKNVALFLSGQGVTLFGSMVVSYAVMWHITLVTKSGVAMMFIVLSSAIPMFFISPFGGVWADRFNKKHLINIADGCIAFVTLIMASLFSFGLQYIALLLICLAMRGLGQGVQTPAVSSLIPEIVPEEQLVRVNGFNSTLQSVVMFGSPIAGGALIAFAPIQTALFVDVVTAIIGISILYFLVKTPPPRRESEVKTAFGDMKEGLIYVKGHAFVKSFLLLGLFFNLLVAPAAMLTPLQVVRNYGEEPWRLVAIELAFIIGMTLGGLIIGVWGGFKNKSVTMFIATVFSGFSVAGLGLFDNFYLYLSCMLAAGLLASAFSAPLMAILQSKVEPDFMGRVFSVMTMLSSIAMPAGMFVWGPLSDIVSIDLLLIISGVGIFALSGMFIFNKPLWEAGITEESQIPDDLDEEEQVPGDPNQEEQVLSSPNQDNKVPDNPNDVE